MEGSSSSYQYSSHVCAPNVAVTMKLSGRDTYDVWKIQMLCLLESHDMLGFINDAADSTNRLWRRSDALVKGWILGSLSEQTLEYIVKSVPNKDFTTKDVWDKLQTIYGPLPQNEADYDEETSPREEVNNFEEFLKFRDQVWDQDRKEIRELHAAFLKDDCETIEAVLSKHRFDLTDSITIHGNTLLHLVVGSGKCKHLRRLLDMVPIDIPLCDIQNSEGSTLLHVAAIVGNTEAAKLLVESCHSLLDAKDNKGQTPLNIALSNMHTETCLFLMEQCRKDEYYLFHDINYEGLINLISSKDYQLALHLVVSDVHRFLSHAESVLMAIAQNFPPEPNFWERNLIKYFTCSDCDFVKAAETKYNTYINAKEVLNRICFSIRLTRFVNTNLSKVILEATRHNAYEVLKIIVSKFPYVIWSCNEDGHNIIQSAVINRSEKIYNLLYQMSEHKNNYRTIKDPFGNNLLHLAARLAPNNKLNHISGAALQLQSELQWFKEVHGFVYPLSFTQKNLFGETPEMVFTREHKELVIDGEKWMKETAQSYTITAALITTIVFAAAITVPGGNKQEIGTPLFANKTAFTVFAVSDAISLFTSVTSLLLFLSILTARFSEQDFLYKLPSKLIIGLTMLFISTTAMLVAFGATLFLMFCNNNPWMFVPITALTCLPITCFVTLQFPLVKDLVSSTYGRGISFGRESDGYFY